MRILNLLLILFVIPCALAQEIKVNPGRYSNYYHLAFEITSENSRLNQEYGFTEEGQFEVFIKTKSFPVPAPNCKNEIILRMPATLGKNAAGPIQRKRALYNQIQKVIQERQGAVNVIIELNPYVTVLEKNPLKLQLEYCNVFFRQSNDGMYKDSL